MVALITPTPNSTGHQVPGQLAPGHGANSELTQRIDSKTFRQVRDLNVVHDSGRVILRGRSESYYVKQLATHAVLDLLPGVLIENSIDVSR